MENDETNDSNMSNKITKQEYRRLPITALGFSLAPIVFVQLYRISYFLHLS